MTTTTTTLWGKLPREIVRIVLAYNGTIKERNGMYMNQLSPSDEQYDLLRTRPIPKEFTFGSKFDVIVQFRNSLFILYVGSGYYYGASTHDSDIRYVFTRRNHAIVSSMCYFRKNI